MTDSDDSELISALARGFLVLWLRFGGDQDEPISDEDHAALLAACAALDQISY